MKRDMNLAREILLAVEASPPKGSSKVLELPGRDHEAVSYHVMLLNQAGLLKAIDCSNLDGIAFIPTSLTWEGHDFIEAARDATIWNKALEKVGKVTSGLSFEIVKQALIVITKHQLGFD